MTKPRKNNKKSRKTKVMIRRTVPELKITDTALTGPVTGTAAITFMTPIGAGTSINNRLGRTVYPKRMIFKSVLTSSTTLIGSTVTSVRVILVQDLQQIFATSPSMNEYFNPTTIIGQRNMYFLERFKVLIDTTLKVDTYNPIVNFNKTVVLNGKMVFGVGPGDIIKNGIYLILVSNNSTNPPNIDLTTRLMFSDE